MFLQLWPIFIAAFWSKTIKLTENIGDFERCYLFRKGRFGEIGKKMSEKVVGIGTGQDISRIGYWFRIECTLIEPFHWDWLKWGKKSTYVCTQLLRLCKNCPFPRRSQTFELGYVLLHIEQYQIKQNCIDCSSEHRVAMEFRRQYYFLII